MKEIILETLFGSKLYGTDNKNSDHDVKGIFMPPLRDLVLCQAEVRESSNINKIDKEYISIHEYGRLLKQGQTMAIDLLFSLSNQNAVLVHTPLWDEIYANRHEFICKQSHAFLGYCKSQSSKYGVKGLRVKAIQDMIEFFGQYMPEVRLADVYDEVPESKFVIKYIEEVNQEQMLDICSRKFEGRCKAGYIYTCLTKILAGYGARAKMAETGEGIDWKAVSHAFRVAMEFKDLLLRNEVVFPLPYADFIKKIKEGRMDYKKDQLGEKLDGLIEEVECILVTSRMQEHMNSKLWDEIILKYYGV